MSEVSIGRETMELSERDQARSLVCQQMKVECGKCSQDIHAQWPMVPPAILEHVLQMPDLEDKNAALDRLQVQFAERPSLSELTFEQLHPLMSRILLLKTEQAATEENMGKRAIIRYQNELSGDHSGTALIDAVRAKILRDSSLTPHDKRAAAAKLDAISTLFAQAKAAISDPQEQAAFTALLVSAPIDLSADTPAQSVAALETAIAGSDQLSDQTKQRLQTLFNTSPVRRGSQLKNLLQRGRGETITSRGEARALAFNKDNALPLGRNTEIYPDQGRYIVKSRMPDGRELQFITGGPNVSAQDIGKKVNQALALSVISQSGILNLHTQGLGATQGTQLIELDTVISGRASLFVDRLLQFCVGNSRGIDGDLLSSEAIIELASVCQWLKPEHAFLGGDGYKGVNEYNSIDPHLVALGLLNEDGEVADKEAFQRVGMIVNSGLSHGTPNYEKLLEAMRK